MEILLVSSGFGVGQRWSPLRGIKARERVMRGLYSRTIQGRSPTCPLLVLGQISSKDPHPLGVPPDSFYKAHCVHSSVGGLKGGRDAAVEDETGGDYVSVSHEPGPQESVRACKG